MLRAVVALLLLAPLAVAAPVPKEVKKKKTTLNGTWGVVTSTFDGRDNGRGTADIWVIDGDKLVLNQRQEDGSLVAKRTVELKTDPDRPGELDYSTDRGKTLYRGLFELTADEFTIAFGKLNGDRPTEVKVGGPYFYKLKRIEDAK